MSSTVLLQDLRVGGAPGAILVLPNAAVSITEWVDEREYSARAEQAEKEWVKELTERTVEVKVPHWRHICWAPQPLFADTLLGSKGPE